ncbi:MAG TPA: hypothetical protein VFQ77_14675 [Pseudonocardiaceae bacterium]|jgi:Arc/MetJ family transcription regulator|nr:hypothetical protein [Pseudonocardiaceae bacterium]
MTKRLVEVDDELLVAAQRASGESTIKNTVQRALELLLVADITGQPTEWVVPPGSA